MLVGVTVDRRWHFSIGSSAARSRRTTRSSITSDRPPASRCSASTRCPRPRTARGRADAAAAARRAGLGYVAPIIADHLRDPDDRLFLVSPDHRGVSGRRRLVHGREGEPRPALGLLAGAALALDYILNVAVGISAGVGALVSAIPSLLAAHARAVPRDPRADHARQPARPQGVGAVVHGADVRVRRRARARDRRRARQGDRQRRRTRAGRRAAGAARAVEAAGAWLLLRAFASGCTAMTGVEAVTNAVPIFRKPAVPLAQRTLTAIIAILIVLLAGIAYLCRAYGIARDRARRRRLPERAVDADRRRVRPRRRSTT